MDERDNNPTKEVGSTFCPRLWTSAFIVENGDVYACCHRQPFKLGNIHERRLEQIWNDRFAQDARSQSLNGDLGCYASCNLRDETARETRPNARHGLTAPYADLRRLKILFGELCNIACIMCWQDHKSRLQLSQDVIKRRDDAAPATGICSHASSSTIGDKIELDYISPLVKARISSVLSPSPA